MEMIARQPDQAVEAESPPDMPTETACIMGGAALAACEICPGAPGCKIKALIERNAPRVAEVEAEVASVLIVAPREEFGLPELPGLPTVPDADSTMWQPEVEERSADSSPLVQPQPARPPKSRVPRIEHAREESGPVPYIDQLMDDSVQVVVAHALRPPEVDHSGSEVAVAQASVPSVEEETPQPQAVPSQAEELEEPKEAPAPRSGDRESPPIASETAPQELVSAEPKPERPATKPVLEIAVPKAPAAGPATAEQTPLPIPPESELRPNPNPNPEPVALYEPALPPSEPTTEPVAIEQEPVQEKIPTEEAPLVMEDGVVPPPPQSPVIAEPIAPIAPVVRTSGVFEVLPQEAAGQQPEQSQEIAPDDSKQELPVFEPLERGGEEPDRRSGISSILPIAPHEEAGESPIFLPQETVCLAEVALSWPLKEEEPLPPDLLEPEVEELPPSPEPEIQLMELELPVEDEDETGLEGESTHTTAEDTLVENAPNILPSAEYPPEKAEVDHYYEYNVLVRYSLSQTIEQTSRYTTVARSRGTRQLLERIAGAIIVRHIVRSGDSIRQVAYN